jgi:stage II sporulation protein D
VSRGALALAVTLAACSTRAAGRTIPGPPPFDIRSDRSIRVAIAAPRQELSATTEFQWLEADGRSLLARGRRDEGWRLERETRGARVRALRPDGSATTWQGSLVLRAAGPGFVLAGGKRYRGELVVIPQGDTLIIVNRVPLEQYLRAVVAVEMGRRPASDSAALQAQAVAARSYAMTRLDNPGRSFDVFATVQDQAYGGVDAENPGATAAVEATRGLVLRYEGRTVDAPYSSTCGGSTAEAPEVWRARGAQYLRRVSDRVGTSDRFYCDIAPRYRWTRTLSGDQLDAALARYLAAYASVPAQGVGAARRLSVAGRTPSGRVAMLEVETERGAFPLRGNDIRFVMRSPGGEILPSTYFSVDTQYGRDGSVEGVTFRGQGNGHGIGMCQWGAIGRSRAGQSFRTILGTYYPGTTVGPVQ